MVAPEQYFPVLIMFISLNKVILTVDSVDEITSVTTQMKATKQYFPVVLFSGAPNDNVRKNICSEDDLRCRIFGTFVVKFLACLPLLGFSNI